jgi:glutaryl-CoA dehydrogenase (non-decarboxylating)
MQFGLTDEQKMMQEMAKDFATREILPTLKEDEADHKFRPELVKHMAELGFFGCALPEEYDGRVGPPCGTDCQSQRFLASSFQYAEHRSCRNGQ